MRLATIRTGNGTSAARIDDDGLVELPYADVGELLATANWRDIAKAASGSQLSTEGADLAPVVRRPSKVICLGLNYRGHVHELGREIPEVPTLFAKFARALIGARDPIVMPAFSEQVDWEAELALVIGRQVRNVSPEEGLDAIAGYCILNDVSVRDWQFRTDQWLSGKTFERTTPVGPAIVTRDEVDPTDLLVRCEVDGRVVQEARTSELIFSPGPVVSHISKILTLDPGDIIATGTPAGVGMGRRPPVYLRAGQTVRTSIEGLGELENECVSEQIM